MHIGQAPAQFCMQDKYGNIFTFPSREELRAHIASLPNPSKYDKKLAYFGNKPPLYCGDNEQYTQSDFWDRVLTYCPLQHNDEEDVVRLAIPQQTPINNPERDGFDKNHRLCVSSLYCGGQPWNSRDSPENSAS